MYIDYVHTNPSATKRHFASIQRLGKCFNRYTHPYKHTHTFPIHMCTRTLVQLTFSWFSPSTLFDWIELECSLSHHHNLVWVIERVCVCVLQRERKREKIFKIMIVELVVSRRGGLLYSFLINSCVSVCLWLAISVASSPANEFRLSLASVLWPSFILHKENPLLQLESSLWPWQAVICQESTSLKFSFCYWHQWIELSMCWKYWNPPKYWHDSEEPGLLLASVCIFIHSIFSFLFFFFWVSYFPCCF